jgi:hypothetical protein
MDNLIFMFLGIIFGGLIMYVIYTFFSKNRSRELIEKQSVVLLEKVRNVCKLIMVEGEFAEIYNHKNNKEYFFGLLSSEKKALLQVNAKVHIGFDLKKIEIIPDNNNKTIILKKFPQPEVLAFENNYQIYDMDEGIFNKFTTEEITNFQIDSKQFILDKIPDSTLMESAKKEALTAVSLMQNIVETIGWKLDYSALKIEANQIKFIK